MNVAARPRHRRVDSTSGTRGNERLTALTGSILLLGFAAEGITILALGRLLTMHVFLGMLLIGPVVLKICSTCYRFTRYYTGSPPYVSKGPPALLPRVLGPFVIITSVAVLGTGVALAFAGPRAGSWLFLHKAAFVLWFGVMALHVLTYAWRLPRLLRHGAAGLPAGMTGERARWLLVAASLACGLILALLTIHLAASWQIRPAGH